MADGLQAKRRRRGEGRGRQLQIKLSEAERQALKLRADARGISMARLLVDGALERPLPPASAARLAFETLRPYYEILDGLRRELGRVGNNVNQLARAAHTTGELPTERRLLEALEEARAAIAAVHGESVRLSEL